MDSNRVLTAQEVANMLKVSTWTVYVMTRRGELPHFSIGRRYRYLRDEIIAWARDEKIRRLI